MVIKSHIRLRNKIHILRNIFHHYLLFVKIKQNLLNLLRLKRFFKSQKSVNDVQLIGLIKF